jgi:hypothetical protein
LDWVPRRRRGLVFFLFFCGRVFFFVFLVRVFFLFGAFVFALVFFVALFFSALVFLVFFVFLKFCLSPGVVAEVVVADRTGIDHDALAMIGLKLHLAEVERGGLQGVEEESGDFRIELPAKDEAHDLHERDLDGVGVLEHGHGEAKRGGGLRVQLDLLALPILVKETEAASAESRGTALGAIGFDMSAAGNKNVVRHERCSTPLPRGLLK